MSMLGGGATLIYEEERESNNNNNNKLANQRQRPKSTGHPEVLPKSTGHPEVLPKSQTMSVASKLGEYPIILLLFVFVVGAKRPRERKKKCATTWKINNN